MTTNKPLHHIRLYGAEATIWPSTRTNGASPTVTLERVYKDGQGVWKTSRSFPIWQLPLARKVLDLATDWAINYWEAASESAAGE